MKLTLLQVLFLATSVVYVSGYAMFEEQIPNGDFIQHPCKPNFVWKGVGHLKMSGGGERNQFGKDFKEAGKKWTTQLCEKDSDGDGIANGVELGDPDCTWTLGTAPKKTTGTSHPGICDPFYSPACQLKNKWVSCDDDDFKCPAIHEEGVITQDLMFPYTNVPAAETTYACMSFDLPSDADYHIIATSPLINETKVMHHILLLGCERETEPITKPTECAMGSTGCGTTIGIWTLGLPGECFYKESGIRIGLTGIKRAVLQFHWTNPEKRTDLWDGSGLKIYYTKNMRKYDASTWTTGQQYLEIPPLSPKVTQHSTCTPKCTKRNINGSIFLTTGLNHMHYLGIAQYVKLIRSDGTELMLTDDEHYSYDSPVLIQYDPPIEVKPGDSFETVCTYRSMSRKKTAFWGFGTYDEMCYAAFGFYPAYAVSNVECIGYKDFDMCDFADRKCDFGGLYNFSNPDTRSLVDSVMDVCSYEGACLHGCRAVVENIKKTHECFKDKLPDTYTYRMLTNKNDNSTGEALRFVAAMKSCDCDIENPIDYPEKKMYSNTSVKLYMSITSMIIATVLTLV